MSNSRGTCTYIQAHACMHTYTHAHANIYTYMATPAHHLHLHGHTCTRISTSFLASISWIDSILSGWIELVCLCLVPFSFKAGWVILGQAAWRTQQHEGKSVGGSNSRHIKLWPQGSFARKGRQEQWGWPRFFVCMCGEERKCEKKRRKISQLIGPGDRWHGNNNAKYSNLFVAQYRW